MSYHSLNSAAILFGQGLNTLVNLLFIPYLARAMSIPEYGTYGQVILIVDLCSILFQFGLYKIIYLLFSNENYDKAIILRNNIIVSFCCGIIPLIGLLQFSDSLAAVFNNPGLDKLLKIYCWSIPLSLVNQSYFATLVYFKKIGRSVILSITSNIVKIGLVFIAVQIFHSINLVFYSMLVAIFYQFTLAYFWLPDIVKGGSFNIKMAFSQLKLGLPFGITSVMGTGFRYVDGIIISLYLSVQDYATYRNGAFELPFISALAGSIGTAILPDLAVFFRQGNYDRITELKKKSINIAIALVIPIVIFILFFGKPLITAYLSDKYVNSSKVFIIYSLILLIRVTDYQALFVVSGKNTPLMFIYGFIFCVNILLNIIFIKLLGIIGPAVAAVICNFTLVYFLLNYSNKIINRPWHVFFDFKAIIIIISISLIIILPVSIIWNNINIHYSYWVIIPFLVFFISVAHFLLKLNLMENQSLYYLLIKMRIPNILIQLFHKFYLLNK